MDFTVEGGVIILRPKGDVMTNFGPRAHSARGPKCHYSDRKKIVGDFSGIYFAQTNVQC